MKDLHLAEVPLKTLMVTKEPGCTAPLVTAQPPLLVGSVVGGA